MEHFSFKKTNDDDQEKDYCGQRENRERSSKEIIVACNIPLEKSNLV